MSPGDSSALKPLNYTLYFSYHNTTITPSFMPTASPKREQGNCNVRPGREVVAVAGIGVENVSVGAKLIVLIFYWQLTIYNYHVSITNFPEWVIAHLKWHVSPL